MSLSLALNKSFNQFVWCLPVKTDVKKDRVIAAVIAIACAVFLVGVYCTCRFYKASHSSKYINNAIFNLIWPDSKAATPVIKRSTLAMSQEQEKIPDSKAATPVIKRSTLAMSQEQEKIFEETVARLVRDTSFIHDRLAFEAERKNLTAEMAIIDQRLQKPIVQKLVQRIEETKYPERCKEAVALLLVVLGVKPALTFDLRGRLVFISDLLREIVDNFPSEITLVESDESVVIEPCYIINEHPLFIFDPRQYLINCDGDIANQVKVNFEKQQSIDACQRLSYLLGFGPSWEAYVHPWSHHSWEEQDGNDQQSQYSKKHYEQLGLVIKPLLPKGFSFSEEEIGRHYHYNFRKYLKPLDKAELLKANNFLVFDETGTGQVVDGLSLRTTYIKQSCFLKYYVLSKLT